MDHRVHQTTRCGHQTSLWHRKESLMKASACHAVCKTFVLILNHLIFFIFKLQAHSLKVRK